MEITAHPGTNFTIHPREGTGYFDECSIWYMVRLHSGN
jgi:hypothetical protein